MEKFVTVLLLLCILTVFLWRQNSSVQTERLESRCQKS